MSIQSIQNKIYSTAQKNNELQKQMPADDTNNITQNRQTSVDNMNNTEQNEQISSIHDEYIPSDKETKPTPGLYKPIYDKDGNPKISFDNPRKKIENSKNSKEPETCTGNTDKVDQEIKKLKEEKKQLEQQLFRASDPQKIKELEKQLVSIEQELQQKDNDTYRRQHTNFS